MIKISNFEHLLVPLSFRSIKSVTIDNKTSGDGLLYFTTTNQASMTGQVDTYYCYKFNTSTGTLENNQDSSITAFFLGHLPNKDNMAIYFIPSTVVKYDMLYNNITCIVTVVYLDEDLTECTLKFRLTSNTPTEKHLYVLKSGSLFVDQYYLNLADDGNFLEYDEDTTVMVSNEITGGLTGESILDNSINAFKKLKYKSINDTVINDDVIISRHLNPNGLGDFKITNFDCALPVENLTYDSYTESKFTGTLATSFFINGSKFITYGEDAEKKYTRIVYGSGSSISGTRELSTGVRTHTQLTNKYDFATNHGITASANDDPTDTLGVDRLVSKDIETGSVILTNNPNLSQTDINKGEIVMYIEDCTAASATIGVKAYYAGKEIPNIELNLEQKEYIDEYTVLSDKISLASDSSVILQTNNTSDDSTASNDIVLQSADNIILNAVNSESGTINVSANSGVDIFVGEVGFQDNIDDVDSNTFRVTADNINLESKSINVSTDSTSGVKTIEQMILDVTRPIGSYYQEYDNGTGTFLYSRNPNTLFNNSTIKSTWIQCFDNEGVFFRTQGGYSSDVTTSDTSTKSYRSSGIQKWAEIEWGTTINFRYASYNFAITSLSNTVGKIASSTTDGASWGEQITGSSHYGTKQGRAIKIGNNISGTNRSSNESRPINRLVKIWVRTN